MQSTKFYNLKAVPERIWVHANAGNSSFLLLVSYVTALISLILFVYGMGLLYQRYWPLQFSELNTKITVVHAAEAEAVPVALEIDSLQLALPVEKGEVSEGEWKLAEHAVSFVDTTEATASGLIIYGHNYPRLLGSLNKVTENDQVELTLSTGDVVSYKITDKEIVSPDSIYSLTPGDFTDLVIYTCTGFLDSQRLIVKAELVADK